METLTLRRYRTPQSLALLVVFLLVVIVVGGLIGLTNVPDAWYAGLGKPPFNPPNWLFGPVWFALYVLMAIAGWRTALAEPTSVRMLLWGVQMLLNWAWSPIWFGLHALWPAFAVIVAIHARYGTNIQALTPSRRQDRAMKAKHSTSRSA